MLLFVAGSVLAHLLVLAALVVRWPGWPLGPTPPADMPSAVEVVMVRQPGQTSGQPATATPVLPAPPVDSSSAAESVVPPQPPQPPASPSSHAPDVNLGGDPSDPWSVRSDTVRPPAPNALYRNLPPRYPVEAVARGESGTVGLVIHVAPDGTADGVDVVEPSGFPALDREARRAVKLWHFTPARRDGEPVPFDFPFSIHFRRN